MNALFQKAVALTKRYRVIASAANFLPQPIILRSSSLNLYGFGYVPVSPHQATRDRLSA